MTKACERAACPTTQDVPLSTSLWKAESPARTDPQHTLVARGTGEDIRLRTGECGVRLKDTAQHS